MRLYPPVTVDGKTVTVNLDLASVDDDVTFNKRKMNIQNFGIAGERSCQIGFGDARQKSLLPRSILVFDAQPDRYFKA